MAERNLIRFDVASPESAICRISPPIGACHLTGSPDIGPWLETRSSLPPREAEHWKRGLRTERTGEKGRGVYIPLLFIISGRSIYDRIGRDGTSSLANRNRDTGRGPASRGTKLKTAIYIYRVYIHACRIRGEFYRRFIAAANVR